MQPQHAYTIWHLIATAVGTATFQRIAVAFVQSMPALPKNASFMQTWLYTFLHAAVAKPGAGADK